MMDRRDFLAMAAILSRAFNDASYRENPIVAASVIGSIAEGYMAVAKQSNPRFDRGLFLSFIGQSLREEFGGFGLAQFNRDAFYRYGKTF